LVVADYDEHSSAAVVAETQAVAAAALNGVAAVADDLVPEYSLGIEGRTDVELWDGTWKRTDTVCIGDVLKHAGVVLGVVKEVSKDIVVSPQGIAFAPSQFVYDTASNKWVRAARRWSAGLVPHRFGILYSLITQRTSAIHLRAGGVDLYIRDYREVPLPEMESAYQNEFITA